MKLEVSEQQRRELLRMVRAPTTLPREVPRARLILLRSEGKTQRQAALEVGLTAPVVRRWERQFRSRGMAGLKDAIGRNRKSVVPSETVRRVVTDALQPPPDGSHWTLVSMARHAGISQTQVHRIWSANGIKPYGRTTAFSSGDEFWDVIGLYLNPPVRVLVLCCDKRTHGVALQRTRPELPLGIGPIASRHFVSHGFVRLLAALGYLDGKVGRVAQRRDHAERLRFLEQVHREAPRGLRLHLIASNDGTDAYPDLEPWLAEHPRIHMHVVPTSGSWLDFVERLFRELGYRAIGKGNFGGVRDLSAAIEAHLSRCKLEPEPYRWCAQAADILAKLERAREVEAAKGVAR